MDEKSGMNFSEYMALLSGNTDLLDKAKLENVSPRSKGNASLSTRAGVIRSSSWSQRQPSCVTTRLS